VDNLSVEDNFFEIGGNSLLALLLFDWIRSELGQDLPISTLFRHQTVRAIALYLDDLSATLPTCGDRDPRDDDWDTTTVIHPGPDETDAPPLFIVGGIGGNVNNLFELGRLLGRHRPVVGFQTRGVLGHRPHETIEDIAADDIHHMRQHQPKGPYSIGSYSGGAYTALEIARQLEAAGETVDHLLVIDSFTPQFAKRHMAAKRPRLSERLSLEFVLFQRNGLSSFVQRLRHQLSAQLVRGPLRPLVKQYGPDQYRYTTMLEAWRIAARGYRGGSVDASVTLFASDPTTSTVLSATRLDPSFGWSDLAAPDRFTRVEVGGSHLDMVKGPSAVLLAEEIEKALKRKPTGADLDYRTDEGKSRLAQ
jgi:thioesterase domain-containing protein